MRLLKWANDFALIIVRLDQMHVSSQKIISFHIFDRSLAEYEMNISKIVGILVLYPYF